MKTLEQLLAEWEEGTLTPEGMEQLKQLLQRPEARAELVEEWLFYEAVYGTLRANPAKAPLKITAPSRNPARVAMPKPSPPPRPRRLFPWLVWREVRIPLQWAFGFALLLCAFGLGFYVYSQRIPVAFVASANQSLVVQRGDSQISAQAGQPLYTRDVLKVSHPGHVVIRWAKEGTKLDLAANTKLQLLNPLRGKRLALQAGILSASVDPQPLWRPMVIQTPQAEATVLGTRFMLDAATASTRLEVTQGTVSLRKRQPLSKADKDAVQVPAGNFALAASDAELKVEPMRGYAIREVVQLPAGKRLFSQSKGTLLFSGKVTNLVSEGRLPGLNITGPNLCEERIRCYVYPPVTGEYTFYLTSSSRAELWLSPDDNPGKRRRVALNKAGQGTPAASLKPGTSVWRVGPGTEGASVNRSAGALGAGAAVFPSQHSDPQRLVAGQRYYLEVVHPFATNQAVLVWWTKPRQRNTPRSEVVSGAVLSPCFELSQLNFP